jgi:hypothetical protein
MQTRSDNDPAEQGISQLNPEELGDDPIEAADIGLPDLPGKTRLPEEAMNIPAHPPDADAPDSMTEAVMENLRVGVGVTSEARPREERE